MATFSDAAWDGDASNYKDTDAYCAACMIDENPAGGKKTQDKCKLPYKEPGGAVNKNALRAIAAALAGARGGVQASPSSKKAAARKVKALMMEAKMEVGDSTKHMAG
jgi:hypothetical protein